MPVDLSAGGDSALMKIYEADLNKLPGYLLAGRPFWATKFGIRNGTLVNLEQGISWIVSLGNSSVKAHDCAFAGIGCEIADDMLIENNKVSNCPAMGIDIDSGACNVITKNTFADVGFSWGDPVFYFNKVYNVNFHDNTIKKKTSSFTTMNISNGDSYGSKVTNNTIQ